MENSELFRVLFEKCKNSKATLMTLPGKQITHYKAEDFISLANNAARLGANTNNYFSVWPRRENVPDGLRGQSDDTAYMTCLFADCDIAGPAHTEQGLPATKDEVQEYLQSRDKPPTVIIDSGYGLYPLWIFKDPFPLAEPSARDKAFGILRGFGNRFIQTFREKSWALDNVFDPARMLRAPGSNNFKLTDPAPCRILWESGIFYAVEDFENYYELAPVAETTALSFDERAIGSAERIMDGCLFTQKMRDDPDGVTEPEWKAVCSNAALTPDGAEKFHDWSSLYSGYSFKETDYKISRAVEAKKPCTCAYIHEKLGFPCPEEGCGVKAPVVLALYSKEEQLQILLSKEELTIPELFDPYSLNLFSYAKAKCISEYVQVKQRLKKLGVSVRDFERAVKSHAYTPAPDAAQDFAGEPSVIQLDGIDLNGAMEPCKYSLSMEDGVESSYYDESGVVSVCLCPEPLVITRRLENIDTGQEKIELAFYRNERWKYLVAPRSGIFSKNSIIKYADSGLPVTSDNAEGVVRYLSAYERQNTEVIPFTRSINRIGWFGKEFYPCVFKGDVIYEDEGSDGEGIVKSICENGDYKLWLKTAAALRQSLFARGQLAASFASPLLELLKMRVIIIHIWHSTRSGKTAGLKFALSVWGDPLKLMGNFNSTNVGLERRAGTLKHLPLGLDELQVLNEKRLSASMIAYSLGNGYGKTRGSKNGGLQDVPTWRNSIISTGEQPLSNESSMDGVDSRVLSLYGPPIEDPEFGRSVHQISEENYGFAGKQYIEYLIGQVLPQTNKLQSDFAKLRDGIKAHFDMLCLGDPGAHLDNIAVLALADAYSAQSIFELSEEQAISEAQQFGIALLTNAKSLEKEDVIERAWSFVQDWIAENRKRFSQDSIPCYGTVDPTHVYIIGTVLRQALEESGFSYSKCIKGFQERGYIATNTDSEGKNRSQTQKRISGVNLRVICANLSLANSMPPEDEFLGEPIQPLVGRPA